MAVPDGLSLKFTEAIDFLRNRLTVSEAEWQELLGSASDAADTVADGDAGALTNALIEAVLKTIEEGGSVETFREEYDEIVAAAGFSYDGDPGWHSQLVFRVNTAIAQAAGRWQQIQKVKSVRPYIRYVTAGDHKVRETHREWHGIILPADHAFWLTHYPPNGFNCRCHPQSVGERDLARFGWSVTDDSDAALLIPPDDGWSGNVGVAGLALAIRPPGGQ